MHKTLQILVVEDEPFNQEVSRVILKAAGHTVTVVGDGTDCVRLCIDEGQPFDLVVMDIAMPKMSGDEATRRLRAHPHTLDIPILGCSAKASRVEQAEAMAAGCTHYITKPFRNKQLLEAIDVTLARATLLTY